MRQVRASLRQLLCVHSPPGRISPSGTGDRERLCHFPEGSQGSSVFGFTLVLSLCLSDGAEAAGDPANSPQKEHPPPASGCPRDRPPGPLETRTGRGAITPESHPRTPSTGRPFWGREGSGRVGKAWGRVPLLAPPGRAVAPPRRGTRSCRRDVPSPDPRAASSPPGVPAGPAPAPAAPTFPRLTLSAL